MVGTFPRCYRLQVNLWNPRLYNGFLSIGGMLYKFVGVFRKNNVIIKKEDIQHAVQARWKHKFTKRMRINVVNEWLVEICDMYCRVLPFPHSHPSSPCTFPPHDVIITIVSERFVVG